ncbi:MAG: ATP-binding domain-containing protein, partial [Moraxellaceae bacterium]
DYFGLNEIFYVDRTKEQDQIISRSPVGPMFVQGVAGSGKTSAALGRAKMLCDFDASGIYEEEEFRKIAGDDMEHWSGKFAGQFSQQGSVGFVRTGELIQYLKETCRRIGLPNLPVEEFQELRSRLRNHRKVERSRLPGARWSGAKLSRVSHDDTTMAWLHAADRAVAHYFARLLPTLVPSVQDIAARFDEEHRKSVSLIAEVAVERMREEIAAVVTSLASAKSDSSFALDGLAKKVFQAIQHVRRRVLDREVLWVTTTQVFLIASGEREMAGLLMEHHVPLFTRSAARLVFVGPDGLADRSLILIDDRGMEVDYGDHCRDLQAKGKLLVRDQQGQTFVALLIDEDGLYLRLLPESVEKPFVLSDRKLRSLSLVRGKGRQKFKIVAQDASSTDEEAELEEAVETPSGQAAEPVEPLKSVDSVFARLLRQGLLLPLTHLADAYAEALSADPDRFPDPSLARVIAAQFAERKLTDEDIDLLLCLAHLIGRGFSQQPRWLSEPAYYQAVFVDEVQDFTEQQVFLMAEQAKPEYRAVTVVGDIAQKLHHGSRIDLSACFPGRSVPMVQLTENLRQLETPRLAWFSTCLRAEFHGDVAADKPAPEIAKRLEDPLVASNGPEWVAVPDEEALGKVILESLSRVPSNQSAVVIFPSSEIAEAWYQRLGATMKERLIDAELSSKVDLARRYVRHFTSVANSKGLEFDVVLMPMVDSYDLRDQQQINRLYVGVTRARRRLSLMHQGALPARLLMVRERYLKTLSVPEESVIE